MKKAGGIIALIASIFGTGAALITLFLGGLVGGIDAALETGSDDGTKIVAYGFGGLVFSFLTIILGAVTMNAKSKIPACLLILCGLAGAYLGGTLVAIAMVLALIGGVIALFDREA